MKSKLQRQNEVETWMGVALISSYIHVLIANLQVSGPTILIFSAMYFHKLLHNYKNCPILLISEFLGENRASSVFEMFSSCRRFLEVKIKKYVEIKIKTGNVESLLHFY